MPVTDKPAKDDELKEGPDSAPLSDEGNKTATPPEKDTAPKGSDLEKRGLLPSASLEVAPGVAAGDQVKLGGESWIAKGKHDGKSILFQDGRGQGFAGEFRVIEGKPDPAQYKELPHFEGQPKNTAYYADKDGQVYKVTDNGNGKSTMSTAQDVKLVEPKEIAAPVGFATPVDPLDTGKGAKPEEKAAEPPKVGDKIDLKGEKVAVAGYQGDHAILHKPGQSNDAVAGEAISDTDLKAKYDEIKVTVDGKTESRYIEKGHPEKGIFAVNDFAGTKSIYQDKTFDVVPKTELVVKGDAPKPVADPPVKQYDPAEKMDLERIQKIAKKFSEGTREVPMTREQFESIFKNLSDADKKLALEIMEQSAPNMTPRSIDEQLRSFQEKLDKLDPTFRKEGITVFTLKGGDSGEMLAQLLRKNQEQLKVNVVELDEAGMKELKAKGIPEKAVILGDPSTATAAQRELLGSVKKLYVSDVNGFDRGMNFFDFGAAQFAGPKAMEEKLTQLVEKAKALQAADKNLSNEDAVRRVIQGDTAKSAKEINANAEVIKPDATTPGRDLRNQVGGDASYRVNSMYEQFTAPQMTPKQVEQFLASIPNKDIQGLTGHLMENGGIQYKTYTQMMKEFHDMHTEMMAKLPPGTKPADILIVTGLEQEGMRTMGKNIDNVGSQMVAAKLYAKANGLGPENFISARELAERGPGAAKGKVLLYVDDLALSGRQVAGVMHNNSQMLKDSGGKIVVATSGKFETKQDAWKLWQTDKRYSGLEGLDVTVLPNKVYKNFYSEEYLESVGLKGRETELGKFKWFKPGHDSGIATYVLTPYGGPNNNINMLDDFAKQTGLRGKANYKYKYDAADAMKPADAPAPLPPPQPKPEQRPERVVPKPEQVQGTDTQIGKDGTIKKEDTRPGEVLAKEQLERRERVEAKEIEAMKTKAEELAKSDKQADKEQAEALKRTVDALEGRLGREAQDLAHKAVLTESRKALERGEGGGYGRAVAGGLIGIGILTAAALAYYRASMKEQKDKELERAKVR